MSTFLLIPGAGGAARYWHRVVPLLKQAGHEAIAVDLPGDDPAAGLDTYAEVVMAEVGSYDDIILVAQSMGGFTAGMVASRAPVRQLVFVNAMIPLPGERPLSWWSATRSTEARTAAAKAGGYARDFDAATYFLHDVPSEWAKDAALQRREEPIAFGDACSFERWPDVPIHVVVGEHDRFFPLELQRRIAKERLGKEVVVIPGGHFVALSQAEALTKVLLGYAAREA